MGYLGVSNWGLFSAFFLPFSLAPWDGSCLSSSAMKSFASVLLTLLFLFLAASTRAESETTQAIADHYEKKLLLSPQAGADFDKLVEWYSKKGGGLNVLQKHWEKAFAKDKNALLLLGLLAERNHQPAEARKLYTQAINMGVSISIAAKFLAALETTEGNFPAAAKAYKKALLLINLSPMERQDIMRSLALLHQRALDAKTTSEEKKEDLSVLFADNPLDDQMRFLVEASLIHQDAAKDPSKVDAKRILACLGFRADAFDKDKALSPWSGSNAAILFLLNLIDTPDKVKEARVILSSSAIPAPFLSTAKFIETWILAPIDPVAALKIWKETFAIRQSSENAIPPNSKRDTQMFLRIAAKHPKPSEVVAVLRAYSTQGGGSFGSEQIFYTLLRYIAVSKTTGKAYYASVWADLEMEKLRSHGAESDSHIIGIIPDLLAEVGDWNRLKTFLDLMEKNRSETGLEFLRLIPEFRDRAALAQGDISKAIPVTWTTPSGDPRKIKLSWQWNQLPPKRLPHAAIQLDSSSIFVSKHHSNNPIPGQTLVEFFFGESPASLAPLAQIKGAAPFGSIEVTPPAPNGFVRAVATVKGNRVVGPLFPILSGKVMFQSPSSSPEKLLAATGGLFALDEQAPNGSPALQFNPESNSPNAAFSFPLTPIQPDKFYVMHAWVHFAKNHGAGRIGVKFLNGEKNINGPSGALFFYENEYPTMSE